MSSVQSQANFFGLSLSSLGQDLLSAWRLMLRWPVFAWLRPKLPVRLWLPTQKAVLRYGTGTARFEAVQLPEHLLLRYTLTLPKLQPTESQAALALQITGLSPFSPDDLVWTHETEPANKAAEGRCIEHLVMTSRKLVAQHVAQNHPNINLARTEVWASSALGQGELVLPGYAEKLRARKQTLWLSLNVLLACLTLLLLLAMALTPSAQLYLRVTQAQQAMTNLQQKAAPAIKQRESLVATTDQLNNLSELMGKPLPPVRILKLITDALPDDTSLLSLRVQGLKVNMSGQTSDATALMKQLGALPGLRDVTAPTPATKPLGSPREQFTIEFTIDSAQLPPAK